MNEVSKGYKALVAEAEAEIETLSVAAAKVAAAKGAVWVDLRDVRELRREGKIPGAVHAPRGMIEFWIDPESPYNSEVMSSADQLILYCSLGWRSALAAKTLQDMGLTNVAHLGGGFDAWRAAGEAIDEPPQR